MGHIATRKLGTLILTSRDHHPMACVAGTSTLLRFGTSTLLRFTLRNLPLADRVATLAEKENANQKIDFKLQSHHPIGHVARTFGHDPRPRENKDLLFVLLLEDHI